MNTMNSPLAIESCQNIGGFDVSRFDALRRRDAALGGWRCVPLTELAHTQRAAPVTLMHVPLAEAAALTLPLRASVRVALHRHAAPSAAAVDALLVFWEFDGYASFDVGDACESRAQCIFPLAEPIDADASEITIDALLDEAHFVVRASRALMQTKPRLVPAHRHRIRPTIPLPPTWLREHRRGKTNSVCLRGKASINGLF